MKFCRPILFCISLILCYITATAQCWKTISADYYNTIGIKQDGTLWSWGENLNGVLGNGSSGGINTTPNQVGTDADWQIVNVSINHALAIKTNGTLWAWGYNGYGQIGDNTTIDKYIPTQIGIENNWELISAGYLHSVALKQDGTIWTWGNNINGRLGIGGGSIIISNPVQIGSDNNWETISAGGEHTLGIKLDGTLWAWGNNFYGQLGDGTFNSKNIPVKIGIDNNWKTISAGDGHCLAVKTDGTLWAWGLNTFGELGDGTLNNSNVPIQIGTSTNWKSISIGKYQSYALKQDGTLWAWGLNDVGQLGDGTLVDKSTPVQIGTNTDWYYLGFSESQGEFAIKQNGSLWGWGANNNGQIGDGTTINRIAPILQGTACAGVLPIRLLSFSGVNKGNYNVLQWIAAIEGSKYEFEIQKSSNAVDFYKIGLRFSAINNNLISTYNFIDSTPVYSDNYYRLKYTEDNGLYKHSDIIRISAKTKNSLSLYPNPVVDKIFLNKMYITTPYSIINAAGQIIQSGILITNQPLEVGHLHKGLYFLKIGTFNFKFFKN